MKRTTKVSIGVVAVLAAAQLVRFPRTDPAVTGAIQAPPEVQSVLRRSCFDCHSNQTVWPWYSQVAPVSWLLHRDVSEGRRHMNFSEWKSLALDRRAKKQKAVGKVVKSGDMPPWFYLPMHSNAKLSAADKQVLEKWAAGPVSD
jgi:Haem-binding domain